MKGKMFFVPVLVLILFSSGWTQEFPIGIWFGGNQNAIDSVSSMNFTWIHGYGGWDRNDSPNYNHILKNNKNFKVVAVLERNINYPSFAQRMQYQAELENDHGILIPFYKFSD
jgi:hypothetical protein